MKVFTVYDSKAEAYLQPFFMRSAGEAVRAVADAVTDAQHGFSKHVADYTLFEIGSWDERTGAVAMLKAAINLGCLVEFKPAKQVDLEDRVGSMKVMDSVAKEA